MITILQVQKTLNLFFELIVVISSSFFCHLVFYVLVLQFLFSKEKLAI
jgi:hypothetical protein